MCGFVFALDVGVFLAKSLEGKPFLTKSLFWIQIIKFNWERKIVQTGSLQKPFENELKPTSFFFQNRRDKARKEF